jgi:pimeloyl-ACP methyl ester carboxylesterase
VKSRSFLFLHGGPGFNSFSEKALLTDAFAHLNSTIEFWNEPSELRPKGEPFIEKAAFPNWYGSIARALMSCRERNQRTHVLAHSYSVHGVVRVLEDYSDVVSGLTLISPALNIYDAYKNMARVGRNLYRESDPEKARQIDSELSLSTTFFDIHLVNSMLLAAGNPALFSQYWENHSRMQEAHEAAKAPEAQMDMRSFIAVNKGLAEQSREPKMLSFDGRVQIIFGEKDAVVLSHQEIPFLEKTFKNRDVHFFSESRHYAHLEETERFARLVMKKP